MSQSTNILAYSLTIAGLCLSFTKDHTPTTLSFDPHATCALLEDLKGIEAFDTEQATGEPVVLQSFYRYGRPGTAYTYWCEFVKRFDLSQRQAEIILEHLQGAQRLQATRQRIERLLPAAA